MEVAFVGWFGWGSVRAESIKSRGRLELRMDRETALVISGSSLLGQYCLAGAPTGFRCVGTYYRHEWSMRGCEAVPLDITDRGAVQRLFARIHPAVVFLTAAVTAVDRCEHDRALAHAVNVDGAAHVASAAAAVGAKCIYISTDYVFGAASHRASHRAPYREDAPHAPLNFYGRTKAEAERVVCERCDDALVARVAVLYGWNRVAAAHNFVVWVLNQLHAGRTVRLFTDQTTTPSSAADVADALWGLVDADETGIYHVAGRDCLDRYAAGQTIAAVFGYDPSVLVPITQGSLDLDALRPSYSCLAVAKVEAVLGRRMLGLRAGLERMRAREEKPR